MIAVVAAETDKSTAARRAAGSSFYAAMRILGRQRREAIFEIYNFCRAVDDIADGRGPRQARQAELAQWRADIDQLYDGQPPARLIGIARAVRQFDLQKPDFLAIIDGMEMDVAAEIRAPTLQTLDLYCERVASAVGRLCVRVFGVPPAAGGPLAHHLGRALQFTNILRDLDEDAAMGRLYLPREALEAATIGIIDPALVLLHPGLERAASRVVACASAHFRTADEIMSRCPRRSVRAPRIMAAAYKTLLAGLTQRGWAPPRTPVRLSRSQLVSILLRYAVF